MPAAIPGIPLIGAEIIKGVTAPSPTSGSPINLTAPGANAFLADLMAGKGFGTGQVSPQDIANSFNSTNAALAGEQARQMGGAASGAAGEAAAYGADNPFAWIEHAKGQVGQQFAGQFGNLAAARAAAEVAQKRANAESDRAIRAQLVSMGAGSKAAQGQYGPYGWGQQKKPMFGQANPNTNRFGPFSQF